MAGDDNRLVAADSLGDDAVFDRAIRPARLADYADSGEVKNVRPITLTTYSILTYRKSRTEPFVHSRTGFSPCSACR